MPGLLGVSVRPDWKTSVTQVLRVALVNDFELILRGLEAVLGPFGDRVSVVELDVGGSPERRVDIALFDTYGHARGRHRPGCARWRWIPGSVPSLRTRGRSLRSDSRPSSPQVPGACCRSRPRPRSSSTRLRRSTVVRSLSAP